MCELAISGLHKNPLNENKESGRLQALSGLDHWIIWTEKVRV